jgi:predicted amidohydrolase YtcJ
MSGHAGLVLRDAEVIGAGVVDVLVRDGVVAAVGTGLAGDEIIDCGRGALLPGLHDHHVHLLATAALAHSARCGPPEVRDARQLREALRSAPRTAGWIRGIGYDESVAGHLDAQALDRLAPDAPVRVQHRSGALWVLNSAGLAAVGAAAARADGIERDGSGRPTGRLWRLDGWLGERLGPRPRADLAPLSRQLAGYGITGVTDATPGLSAPARAALGDGTLAQRLTLLGDPGGTAPVKIVVPDHELPSWDELTGRIRAARPRPVALHAVTRASLVLSLAALADLGPVAGDRIEHAAVAPPETVRWMARLGVAVVTQPSLPALRGDQYLDRADAEDLPYLWPFRSLADAGVAVGCSSDAPYGDLDPWRSMAAAAERRAPSGRPVAPAERVSTRAALRGYLSRAEEPGGPERRVAAGSPADLALLDRPLAAALAGPRDVTVRATFVGGRLLAAGDGSQ